MLRAPSGHMTLSGAVWCVNYTIQVFCSKQKCLIDTHEGLQFCNLADIVCVFNIATECELVRRKQLNSQAAKLQALVCVYQTLLFAVAVPCWHSS